MTTSLKSKWREFISRSPEETRRLGRILGKALFKGDVLALSGELGAGKTCFIQGVARGLGVEESYLASPSFVIMRQYQGRLPFYHIDLYRLSSEEQIDGLGLEEFLEGEGVSAVEWAERAPRLFPAQTIRIKIFFLEGSRRRIEIEAQEENHLRSL